MMMEISRPQSAYFDEFRDEMTAEVQSDEGFEPADAGSANENGGSKITRGRNIVGWRWRWESRDLMVI